MKRISFLILLSALALGACDSAPKENEEEKITEADRPKTRLDSLKERMGGNLATGTEVDKAAAAFGEKVAMEAAGILRSNLQGAMEEGGVEQALVHCFEAAETLHQPLAQKYEAQISRVSHKPRNPDNEASGHEKELISILQSQLKTGEEVPALKEETDAFTYYHPIITQQMCLNCHGVKEQDIAELDLMTIELMYPTDRATGFKAGDIRGLWKVRFSKNRLQQEMNSKEAI
ncbi:MAG: DUF3365 domain-containing protein [Bacteroidia bacterium]